MISLGLDNSCAFVICDFQARHSFLVFPLKLRGQDPTSLCLCINIHFGPFAKFSALHGPTSNLAFSPDLVFYFSFVGTIDTFGKTRMPKAFSSDTITAARKAPVMLPSPPITTTTKISTMIPRSMV